MELPCHFEDSSPIDDVFIVVVGAALVGLPPTGLYVTADQLTPELLSLACVDVDLYGPCIPPVRLLVLYGGNLPTSVIQWIRTHFGPVSTCLTPRYR